jgi:hypothetical protein
MACSKEGEDGEPHGVIVRDGAEVSLFFDSEEGVVEIYLQSFAGCWSSKFGAVKVSGAIDDLRPNKELLKLFPLPFDVGRIVVEPEEAAFVGVGGISSPLACTSMWPRGDLVMSSSAILRKLVRRFDLPEEQPRPKMFTPFPNDSGDA